MTIMVEIESLRKTFGSIIAVDGVSFTIGKGEVLGFLGPRPVYSHSTQTPVFSQIVSACSNVGRLLPTAHRCTAG